jgi:protease YdgD
MYLNGQGVKQDHILAHMWFDLSAARGTQIAVTGRDFAARQMTPTQIAEAQKLAHDWKPKRHREIVDMRRFPWSSIGKVGSGGQLCTGSVIGPNQFLTAAHCLYKIATARFMSAGSINILLGYEKGEYRVHRVASRYTIPPAFDPSLITYPRDQIKLQNVARYDWAIVYIDEPFPADLRPLRLASATPSPGTALEVAGYPIERPHILTADPHCRVTETSPDKKLIFHDCVIHSGDSGAPFLSRDDESLILGVSSIVPNLLVQLRDQSTKWGIAVSAASISEFLGSQSGAPPSQAAQ